MTKATAEVFGQITSINSASQVLVANIEFTLPEGESAAAGQFIKAQLTWDGSTWLAKAAEIFDAQPQQQAVITATHQNQATGTEAAQPKGFAGFHRTTQPAAPAAPAAATPPQAQRTSMFNSGRAAQPANAVIPLRPAPSTEAKPAAPNNPNTSRFGSLATAKAPAARPANPVAPKARPAFDPNDDTDIPF